jgi:non-ribosomal peptide synthetase component F
VAVIAAGQELSYGQLNARANQLAHYLRDQGIGPDSLVALCTGRSAEMLIGMLGILKAGGACVPLDPAWPATRTAYVLGDAAPCLVLTRAAHKDALGTAGVPVIALDADWAAAAGYPATAPGPDIGLHSGDPAGHLAYVAYTSGCTAEPKGVMVEHAQLAHLVHALRERDAMSPQDRMLQCASPGTGLALQECCSALAAGCTLVLADAADAAADPAGFWQHCADHRICPPRPGRRWWQSRMPWCRIAFARSASRASR